MNIELYRWHHWSKLIVNSIRFNSIKNNGLKWEKEILHKISLRKMPLKCYEIFLSLLTASIALMFIVMIDLRDSHKSTNFIIFFVRDIVALFASVLVVMVIRFERACWVEFSFYGNVPTNLQNFIRKRIMLINKMLSCTALGYFMSSLLATNYMLVPPQLRWIAMCVELGFLILCYGIYNISFWLGTNFFR